jgi:hypothetical protein
MLWWEAIVIAAAVIGWVIILIRPAKALYKKLLSHKSPKG